MPLTLSPFFFLLFCILVSVDQEIVRLRADIAMLENERTTSTASLDRLRTTFRELEVKADKLRAELDMKGARRTALEREAQQYIPSVLSITIYIYTYMYIYMDVYIYTSFMLDFRLGSLYVIGEDNILDLCTWGQDWGIWTARG